MLRRRFRRSRIHRHDLLRNSQPFFHSDQLRLTESANDVHMCISTMVLLSMDIPPAGAQHSILGSYRSSCDCIFKCPRATSSIEAPIRTKNNRRRHSQRLQHSTPHDTLEACRFIAYGPIYVARGPPHRERPVHASITVQQITSRSRANPRRHAQGQARVPCRRAECSERELVCGCGCGCGRLLFSL